MPLLRLVCPFLVLVLLGVPVDASVAQDGRAPKAPTEEASPAAPAESSAWTEWYRPVDTPVFTKNHGNNHDSILFVDMSLEYPYHLIISHEPSGAHLWRTKTFSWDSADWELVSEEYNIGGHYEYDDGVKVNGTYYIFEAGTVYTYSGSLEDADGNWEKSGSFPSDRAADVGVYYEDGTFHIFGENGEFPHGYDGTHLSHFTSETGLGNWELVDQRAVDPNPDGGHKYGVGDPTIARIEGTYYLFCDRETKDSPYKVTAWKSASLNSSFEYLGKVIQPRSEETDDWDNPRIQDPDIQYIPELSRYVMTCNMKDLDGTPGAQGRFPNLSDDNTRVIGTFYSKTTTDRPADP